MTAAPDVSPPMQAGNRPLALFGGTFDPVHWGHLRVALDTANALKLNIQTGKQAANCNITIQPRVGQAGSCGAALGPPLTLSPAFSLQ